MAVAYASETRSLAVLEVLVHLQDVSVLTSYSLVAVTFPDELVRVLADTALPPNWKQSPAPQETRDLGDKWVAETRSAILRVPSAIIEEEYNYLINPAHPDFARLKITEPKPLRLDPRLVRP